ncbi:SNF5-domain-containing protein [Microthyrium microscopicum]|uniref:SNF5-domain-containing protein n=1 Tax=Microthyrium microscopicum TaxID=703497 RepID=A0A6A6U6B3_9PEZI|nr:SNF5-domain-containing protein [Microthyrium microscopicum]
MASVLGMPASRQSQPQAFISSYAPRLRNWGNSLLAPVVPQVNTIAPTRTTKRGTTAINYAEDGYDDDFGDGEDGPRRPTGLRSLRRDDSTLDQAVQIARLGDEAFEPVHMQGIWRDWMGKPRRITTRRQGQVQAELPVTLIPIRVDIDIQPFRPDAPLPTPHNAKDFGIDETLPAYRPGDPTPQYRIKDVFLWNLHEALITPEQFAKTFVDELDLPADRKHMLINQIATQIRTQLEEYAGVALHPLFQSNNPIQPPRPSIPQAVSQLSAAVNTPGTSTPNFIGTPIHRPATPYLNGLAKHTNGKSTPVADSPMGGVEISAKADAAPSEDTLNPDDAYRCIISLNVNILNKLYTDKFEWSLLHPPGYAESFAKVTCADLGLAAEWGPAIAHAIYEAVLGLKKEACENGGVLTAAEIDNDGAEGVEAGWRYEPETLAEDWEPKVEILTKDEIDRREGDRERQVRRRRRETARFSSTANMTQNDYFAIPDAAEQPMGRGERSKKKRRFRSLSPSGRDTPDNAGYGGGTGLQEDERRTWRCFHCFIPGSAVWAVRDGPNGPRSLCHSCGFLYERDKRLPPWSKNLHGFPRAPSQR